ncbi:MAG: kinase-like protein [Monoraphidium minutum]|nr:MAG: kinase-like protein [Monoraphidium minutum]
MKPSTRLILPQASVVRLLGAGAFGEVFLARWRGTEVAVKCLSPALLLPDGAPRGAPAPAAAADLLREAGILAGLRHPNVVAVYGAVLPDGTLAGGGDDAARAPAAHPCAHAVRPPALVVEYLSAGSLRSALDGTAEWLAAPQAKVKLLLDTARGLEYVHSKHIVHFDLKSANILVGVRDKVPHGKITDFGLAKTRRQTYVTGVNSLRGTLPWMAPEVLRSPDTVDEASDVYGFGVVMWELWTGAEPFQDLPLHALLHALVQPEGLCPPLPGDRDWDAGWPAAEPAPGWAALVARCWARAPRARPAAAELVSSLEAMAAELRRRRVAAAAAAAAVAAGAAAPAAAAGGGARREPAAAAPAGSSR